MLTETCEQLVTTCAAPAYATVESEPADCRSQTDSCQSATHITVADHITDHVERLLAKWEYYAWASLKLTHGKFRSIPTSIILLLAVHVFCMDCATFVAMASRLLLRTLCSNPLYWPRLHYVASAWWGFTNATDRNRFEAFIRRAVKHGYCADTIQQLSPRSVTKPIWHYLITYLMKTSSTHALHILLSPKVEKHYSTRPRGQCYQLPHKTSVRY